MFIKFLNLYHYVLSPQLATSGPSSPCLFTTPETYVRHVYEALVWGGNYGAISADTQHAACFTSAVAGRGGSLSPVLDLTASTTVLLPTFRELQQTSSPSLPQLKK